MRTDLKYKTEREARPVADHHSGQSSVVTDPSNSHFLSKIRQKEHSKKFESGTQSQSVQDFANASIEHTSEGWKQEMRATGVISPYEDIDPKFQN